MQIATRATHRFSILGIVCVALIVLTGIVNSAVLVGSFPALVESGYGRVLLIKITVFFLMLGLAADNLLRLRHRINEAHAMGWLQLNALLEAWFGFLVIAIVGVLGTMTPATHLHHVH